MLVGAVDPALQDSQDRDGLGVAERENAESLTVSVDAVSLTFSENAESLTLPKNAEMVTLPEDAETVPVSDDISSLQVSAAQEEDIPPTSNSDSSARSCSLRVCRALLLPQPIFADLRFV